MVDLIYADEYGREVGILPYASGDFTVGVKNSFELQVPAGLGLAKGWFLMIDGMEYGGIIDGLSIDTTKDYVTVSGRTWHGLLETKIICPDAGADYFEASGDLNDIIGIVLARVGLSERMEPPERECGIRVDGWKFDRYTDAYTGLRKLLRKNGCKLSIAYDGDERKAVLSAVKRGRYVDDGIDGDTVAFKLATTTPVNHLIYLGAGELKDRSVAHAYADENGVVSTTQTLFGTDEKAETREATSSEGEKLQSDCLEKLRELQAELSSVALKDVDTDSYDIDDIVGGASSKHGIAVETMIAQKIATVTRERLTVETKTETEV